MALCCLGASESSVSDVEQRVFHLLNELTDWAYGPLWLVMQLGSLGAVFVAAAVAGTARRFRLAAELLAAGLGAYYSAVALKNLVDRGRPAAVLDHVVIRGSAVHGLGFPSGHAAVSCALTATAFPFLAGRWRWAVWMLPVTVGFTRVYIGAHLPLDVIGGFALGYSVGALVHLIGGSAP